MSFRVYRDILSIFDPIAVDIPAITLYQVRVSDFQRDLIPLIIPILPPEDWDIINRLSLIKTRQKLMLSRGLLRILLSHFLGVKPTEIKLAVNPWGKLFLPGHALQFNLTHSGCYLVFALGEGYSIGVDVEQIRPLQCPHRLIQRYATPTEQTRWQTLSPTAQQRYFFELWVAKEAYAKALGTGLRGMLREFANLHTLNQTCIRPPGGWPAHLRQFSLGYDYVGAVCWGATPGVDASIPARTQLVDHFLPQFR